MLAAVLAAVLASLAGVQLALLARSLHLLAVPLLASLATVLALALLTHSLRSLCGTTANKNNLLEGESKGERLLSGQSLCWQLCTLCSRARSAHYCTAARFTHCFPPLALLTSSLRSLCCASSLRSQLFALLTHSLLCRYSLRLAVMCTLRSPHFSSLRSRCSRCSRTRYCVDTRFASCCDVHASLAAVLASLAPVLALLAAVQLALHVHASLRSQLCLLRSLLCSSLCTRTGAARFARSCARFAPSYACSCACFAP